MIDVQVRNLPPMRTTRKVRIIEIGSCWRFGPCRFSSYRMYLNVRTNHSLFYLEYISAQVIIPRPHPQHILFPTSHEYLLSLALEWMIKFSPGLKNIYTIPQVLLVNKYYKLNSFFWSFFFDVLSWFILTSKANSKAIHSCRNRWKYHEQAKFSFRRAISILFQSIVFKVIKIYFAGSILPGSQASKFLTRAK